jgi:hypothetical protein
MISKETSDEEKFLCDNVGPTTTNWLLKPNHASIWVVHDGSGNFLNAFGFDIWLFQCHCGLYVKTLGGYEDTGWDVDAMSDDDFLETVLGTKFGKEDIYLHL